MTRVRINDGNYRTSLIEGYCSHQSITAGEELKIFVSTNPARRFTIDLYRMGYYGGAGARKMRTLGPFHGIPQETPEIGEQLFSYLVSQAESRHTPVGCGRFGANMAVSLTNDGPVTFWLEVKPDTE